MTRNANNERVCYRMHGVVDNLDRVIVNFILFAHDFTACDSTPAIYKLGSKQFFPNLQPPIIYDEFLSSFFLTASLQKELVMHLSASSKNSIPQEVVSNKFGR